MRRFATIDSTNRYLLDQARTGAPEGVVAVADHQTGGRGRQGRTWVAWPGTSLLASFLLRPQLPVGRLHLVPAAVALAARQACRRAAGFLPGLKWPNDLVCGERKLAGVLAESELPAVVVGIGVNLNWPYPMPGELAATATAANHEVGREVDREAVLGGLLDELARLYGRWDEVGAAYRAACTTIGRPVRVELTAGTLTGTAIDVTDDGRLLVETGGVRRSVLSGDVIHVRPGAG